eukprot:5414786-Amphidinium_carterae.1
MSCSVQLLITTKNGSPGLTAPALQNAKGVLCRTWRYLSSTVSLDRSRDIAAIRALAKTDPRIEQQIPYCLSIFCGGLPSRGAALAMAKYHEIQEDDIGVCRFRGRHANLSNPSTKRSRKRFDIPTRTII